MTADRPISLLFVLLGAATASWDVVGVDIAGRTLKLTTLAFLIGAVLRILDDRSVLRWSSTPPRYRVAIALAAALLMWMLVRSLFTPGIVGSFGGFASQLTPAAAPFIAVIWHHRHTGVIVRTFVYGMAASSVLAVYEFVARRSGWFWFTDYDGSIGDRPRSASFAFEAAYFAAPAVAALIIAIFWWRRGTVQAILIALLGVGIALADARIVAVQVVVAIVVLAVLALVMRGAHRARMLRSLAVMTVVGIAVVALASAVAPNTVARVGERIGSIFDPDEATSNSPRLEQNQMVAKVIRSHPIFGVGPGQLGAAFDARGYLRKPIDALDEAKFVTNNIWTQTLIDGGIIALVLQISFLIAIGARTRRDLSVEAAAVFAAWASLVFAAGLTVSNFWDTEPWLLLACYVALTGYSNPTHRASDDETPPSQTSTPTPGEPTLTPDHGTP